MPSGFANSNLPTELIATLRYSIFMFALVDVLNSSGYLPTGGWQLILVFILQTVPMFTLAPRFILSMRELYAQDVQGRCGEGIDTGFGLSFASCTAVGTASMFADVEQSRG